jgi:hypothetical protein
MRVGPHPHALSLGDFGASLGPRRCRFNIGSRTTTARHDQARNYSHSMVEGGLELMS